MCSQTKGICFATSITAGSEGILSLGFRVQNHTCKEVRRRKRQGPKAPYHKTSKPQITKAVILSLSLPTGIILPYYSLRNILVNKIPLSPISENIKCPKALPSY